MNIAILWHLVSHHQSVRDIVADLAIAKTHLDMVRGLYSHKLGTWLCEGCGQPQGDAEVHETSEGVHLCQACVEEFLREAEEFDNLGAAN